MGGLGPGAARRVLGEWERVAPAVYATPLFDPAGFESCAWRGLLHGGDAAHLGLHAAAVVHGLQEPEHGRDIDVYVDHRVADLDGCRFVRARPGVRLPPFGRPPRTGIEDTVLDLCDTGSEEDVVRWLTRATQQRLTTVPRLLQRADARERLRHRRFIADVLGGVSEGVTTPLERRALVDVVTAHGLPRGRWQARDSTRRIVVDQAYEAFGLVVEYDGKLGHVGEGAFRDRRRDNDHALAGTRTLRFGWADVTHDPCGCARDIASLLRLGGWGGSLSSCPRCPAQASARALAS